MMGKKAPMKMKKMPMKAPVKSPTKKMIVPPKKAPMKKAPVARNRYA